MKISQKKTCFGCKALYYTLSGNLNQYKDGLCRLGYDTGAMIGNPNETLPIEPCPKPMTKDDFYIANVELRKGAILGKWLQREVK